MEYLIMISMLWNKLHVFRIIIMLISCRYIYYDKKNLKCIVDVRQSHGQWDPHNGKDDNVNTTFSTEKSLEKLMRGFASFVSCEEVSSNNYDNSTRTFGSHQEFLCSTEKSNVKFDKGFRLCSYDKLYTWLCLIHMCS